MNHVDDLIQRALDGTLTPDARAKLHAHLRECARCRRFFHHQTQIDTRLRTVPRVSPSPNFARRIHAQLAVMPAPRRPAAWQLPLIIVLFLAGGYSMLLAQRDFVSLAQQLAQSSAPLLDWTSSFTAAPAFDPELLGWLNDRISFVLVLGLCAIGTASMLLLQRQGETR